MRLLVWRYFSPSGLLWRWKAPLVVINPGLGFKLTTVISLTAGTMFLMWLGEQITERGLGNGISILILVVSLLVCLLPLVVCLSWFVLVP